MTSMFQDCYIDLFDIENVLTELVNFASGAMVSSELKESMTGALKKGKEVANQFVRERLVGENIVKTFYDKLPRCSIKTMASMKKAF